MIRTLRDVCGVDVPLIGVGGIQNAADAKAMLDAGADLLQIYTGLIYKGDHLLKEIKLALA